MGELNRHINLGREEIFVIAQMADRFFFPSLAPATTGLWCVQPFQCQCGLKPLILVIGLDKLLFTIKN